MAALKGSQTEKNLLKSFAGESQARNRYTYAAAAAEKEGYPFISRIFLETADNERVHAKTMFKFLEGGTVEITASYPAGKIGTTLENLLAAAEGEHEEHTALYPGFADTAQKEGFNDVAAIYRMIAKAESFHENRYRGLIKNLQEGTQFKKAASVKWKCDKCGYVHEGPEAPKICPACKHEQKHFELFVQNW
jgi:rubrerythrin